MDFPWIAPLRDRLGASLTYAAQWQGALGLLVALAGTWIVAVAGGRVLDAILLRAGRNPKWRLTPCWLMGMLAGLTAPGRGHRDRDALSLIATGRLSTLGSSWFGMGAAGGTGLLALSMLLPGAHPATAPALVGVFAAGAMLSWRERGQTWGAIGGLAAGWCALILGALMMAKELDSLAGLVDIAPWSRPIDAIAWLGVGCLLQVMGHPRGLVLVVLPALVYGGLLPLHTALATTAGSHLGRAIGLFFGDLARGPRVRRAERMLQAHSLVSCFCAIGLTAVGMRFVVGTPWAGLHGLECIVALEVATIFVSTQAWIMLGYPLSKLLRRNADTSEQPDHRAVQRPSVVVLGAIQHALEAGDLAIELSTQVLVPFSHRSLAGAVHSLQPAGALVRRSELLRESLENLVAQVNSWERSEYQSQLLAAALRCAEERFQLIDALANASLEPSRHQPAPSKPLVPYFDGDLVERAKLLKQSMPDRGAWAPLDASMVETLEESVNQLRLYLGAELGQSILDPGMHTRLCAQLDARRELTACCVRVAESPLPRLLPSDNGLLQQNYEHQLSLAAGDTELLDRVDDRAA